jgi:hypothetical protein
MPSGKENSVSHCQPPLPFLLKNDIYRIFYGSRNSKNYTQIFYCDYDIKKLQVLHQTSNPVIASGKEGFFDENGIYPSSIVQNDETNFMYTIGYSKGYDGMFYMRIGLAKGDDQNYFIRYSEAPILNTSEYDPWIVTAPFVLKDKGIFRMWYVSGDKCSRVNGKLESKYQIKYAESKDGITWIREGVISIGYKSSEETNIARPWVIKEDGIYKAWYCYCSRGEGYRIGYAESRDGGYTFKRMDHLAGIYPSDEPWESEAVSYPAVIVHNGLKYMFYNGNKFGKDGIALAVEEKAQ